MAFICKPFHLCLVLSVLNAGINEVEGVPTCEASGSCSAPTSLQTEHIMLQAAVLDSKKGRQNVQHKKQNVVSDCAGRLQDFGPQGGAACIVIQSNRALLVKVPYGRHPGWDFPGGLGDKGHEAACETAERETCEETGYRVRAVAKLTHNVFRCDVVAANFCWKAVDEGFLEKRWFSYDQISSLRFRGYTWGDKQDMLKRHLTPGSEPEVDDCGCTIGVEGWSSTRNRCHPASETDPSEAAQCRR